MFQNILGKSSRGEKRRRTAEYRFLDKISGHLGQVVEGEGKRERRTLEKFVTNNPELEKLEILLDEFDIFEALGAVSVKLRHTDFLA